jgi:hypothetical protein
MRAPVTLERSTWRLMVAFSKEQPAQLMHHQILSQVTRFKPRKKFKVVNAVRLVLVSLGQYLHIQHEMF